MQETRKPVYWIVICALVIVPLVVGLLAFRDYGESWDEASKRSYADYALNAYQYLLHPQDLPLYGSELNYYGPAYFMMTALLARGTTALIPAWTVVNAWHFVYFLTFLAGVYVLYLLSKRWMSEWAAFGVALLYCTQPLLWGHAFINPKDTPFAAFFMASLYLGFKMVDASNKKYTWAILAGLVLGLSTSFRILAPYAAILVTYYALRNNGKKAISFLIVYAITAIFATYLTWPYLWADPIRRFLESLRVMSAFPFDQTVLFRGELYPAANLPLTYVPTLLRLQLTEPLLILFVFGFFISVIRFLYPAFQFMLSDLHPSSFILHPFLLFIFWCLLPMTGIIVSGNTLYDNFRQLFFLLPPVFILAGLTLDYVFRKFRTTIARLLVLLLLSSSGIVSAIQLHPYEYVYYNSFVDGTRGAFRNFEMDYWDTSFAEAAQYLNQVAPQNAKVIVIGAVDLFRAQARPDMQVVSIDVVKEGGGMYDYVVIHSRRNLDERRCKDAQTVYTVERQGAVLVVVKQLMGENQCP
jgi:4-amino-4-deoxy-L-arabinose transferase-like glycosyltransferase